MENKEEGEEPVTRGSDWEVVSLTESAYGAPGPKENDLSGNRQGESSGKNEAETSTAMFMSGHFVFPPCQHENLHLEPEYSEIKNETGSRLDVSRLIVEENRKSCTNDEESLSIKPLMPDEFSGIPIFDEKGNDVSGMDFKHDLAYDKEQSVYGSAAFSSAYNETDLMNSNIIEEVRRKDGTIEDIDRASDSSLCSLEKHVEGDNYDDCNLPCEAWWKRRVVSFYAHAKETNSIWSICIAAAVMGLVIIGHQWQQERWQILHLKWHSGIKHERMGTMLGPMSRLKDVIVGGHRRGLLVRGSSSI